MFCPNCGKEIVDEVKFCSNCGKPTEYNKAENNFSETKKEDVPPELSSKYSVISTSEYLGALVLYAIPVVGWVAAIVWAVGGTQKINKKNMAKAMLIMIITNIIISILIAWLLGKAFSAIGSAFSGATGLNQIDIDGLMNMVGGSSGLSQLESLGI